MSGIVEKAQESRTVNTKTRITAFIRDAMIAKALDTSGINARKKQLIEDRAAFAEDVRQYCLKQSGLTDLAIKTLINATLKTYPAGHKVRDFLNISMDGCSLKRFNVNLSGMDIYLWLDGRSSDCYSYNASDDTHLTPVVEAKLKAEEFYTPRSRYNVADQKLTDRFIAFGAAKEKIDRDQQGLENTLRATIKRFGTVETMLEAWPQAEELLPAELRPSTGLALSTDDLNAICGIPTGKAE